MAVGAHVGRRDVVFGADVLAQCVRESSGDSLKLHSGDRVRVELDAAFAAPERQTHKSAFPRHHRRERFHIVERDLRVVAHPALERPQEIVVLHAITLEEANLPAVHPDREVHDQLVLRLGQDRLHVRLDLSDPGGPVEVILNRLVKVVFFGRHALLGGRQGGWGQKLVVHRLAPNAIA